MLQKGTMRLPKKILGGILLVYGAMGLFGLNYQIPLISNAIFHNLVMLAAGYFLVISGRQIRG